MRRWFERLAPVVLLTTALTAWMNSAPSNSRGQQESRFAVPVAGKPSPNPLEAARRELPGARQEPYQGRLPPYYGQVVSDAQRQRIYDIQGRYAEKIEPLKAQLAELEKAEQQEIEAVLTAEQQKKISELAAQRGKKVK